MTDIETLACAKSYERSIVTLTEEMGKLAQAVGRLYEDETPRTRQDVVEAMTDVQIGMDVIRCLMRIDDDQITDMRHHRMQRNLLQISDS